MEAHDRFPTNLDSLGGVPWRGVQWRAGGVPVAYRWRAGGVPVAYRWRAGGVQWRAGCVLRERPMETHDLFWSPRGVPAKNERRSQVRRTPSWFA
jgi:hypothetical protein